MDGDEFRVDHSKEGGRDLHEGDPAHVPHHASKPIRFIQPAWAPQPRETTVIPCTQPHACGFALWVSELETQHQHPASESVPEKQGHSFPAYQQP